jgi:PPOX class probable F420-dependent enzyme
MAVTLTPEEIQEFVRGGHTVIVSTNGPGGYPHSVPLWYVLLDGELFFRTMARSQKARNIERDNRIACLVETGEAWIDLRAVMIRGLAEKVEDPELFDRISEEIDRKYSAFRTVRAAMPEGTRQHYEQQRVCYRVVPRRKTVSWWNRKLRIKPEAGPAPSERVPG